MAQKAVNRIAQQMERNLAALIELGRVDTVYRDLYLRRAKDILKPVLSKEKYREFAHRQSLLSNLSEQIRHAIERSDWPKVKEFSGRLRSLQQSMDRQESLLNIGKQIYDTNDVPLDPFSPGLQSLGSVTAKEPPELRNRVIKELAILEQGDPTWRDFYTQRRATFQNLTLTSSGERPPSGVQVHREALAALTAGNLEHLEQVADSLLKEAELTGHELSAPPSETNSASGELLFSFSKDTLARAKGLGLVAARAEAYPKLVQLGRPYAWYPTFTDQLSTQAGPLPIPDIPLPADTPEPLKNLIQQFSLHPFVNSGGARILPTLVTEDFLVEDFVEPEKGIDAPGSELLSALGFSQRSGLTRLQIEQALFEHGPQIVEEKLDLDARAFRLVCIPLDLYARFGLSRGWGQQQIWTHFDGYQVMRDHHLRALAGGDVRFGGVYDLVSIEQNYESERIIVRFAVAQRKRMPAW